MHSSRMHTSRCSGNLSCHACPPGHAHPYCHACPCHVHPLPTHTPHGHACLLATHTHTPATYAPFPGHKCPPVNRMTEGVKVAGGNYLNLVNIYSISSDSAQIDKTMSMWFVSGGSKRLRSIQCCHFA